MILGLEWNWLTPIIRPMLKRSRIFLSVVIGVLVAFTLQGCVVSRIMNSQDRKNYSDYVLQTNQLNTDREKAGLPPVKVMTFDEWHGNGI